MELGDVPADIRTGLMRIIPALANSADVDTVHPPNIKPKWGENFAYNLAQQQLSDMETLKDQFPFAKV
jgi:hypothetical protein